MKGSGMWMSRRQVRWLIVLLALLPLVPVIQTMRLTLDNARRDRDDAVEAETRVYRDQLIHLVNRISQNALAAESGDALFVQLRRIFGDDVTLILRDDAEEASVAKTWNWGPAPTQDAVITVIRGGRYAGWTVTLDRVVILPETIAEQMSHAWWRAGGWLAGVSIVAAAVWFAVHRGLRVDELRSDLLTTVSHEMKTPLASMRVLLETLTDPAPVLTTKEKRREYLDLILRENGRLTRLADDFLTFARLERGDFRLRREPCDLRHVVRGVVADIQPAIELADARVACDFSAADGLMALGDGDAIAAVVRNLLENALKYGASAEGGTPDICVHVEPLPDRKKLRLSVSDHGPGIPNEYRRAVFRRYFRIDSRLSGPGSGVGLGLAICRHLAKKMRGRIELAANPGGGCRFFVTLPAASVATGASVPSVAILKPSEMT
jgi:signal transduction histidine kinase